MSHRYTVIACAAMLTFLAGCQKTEAEKFDEKFTSRQSEIEAKAKAMEAEADRMTQAQPDEGGAAGENSVRK